MVTVEHDGLGWFGLSAFLRLGLFALRDGEQKLLAVRGPPVVVKVLFHIGELLGFAAAPVKNPDLRALGVALTAGGERQIAAVGTPARIADRFLTAGELDILGPVPTDHPEIRDAL